MAVVLLAFGCGSDKTLREEFANPGAEYRVIGGLNLIPNAGPYTQVVEEIDTDEAIAVINASLEKSVALGYGGVNVTPSRHPYFTEQWFDLYKAACEKSKELGTSIVMYDDIEYPSGTAGDRIKDVAPEHRARLLTKTEKEYSGPVKVEGNIFPYQGVYFGAVAFNPDTKERIVVSLDEDKKLFWDVPEGTWKVMAFSYVQRGRMIDIMDDDAVEKYIDLCYTPYTEHLGRYYGSVITQNFFDDIGFWYWTNPWTIGVDEIFAEKYGKNILEYMPALWYDMGEETQASRAAIFGILAEKAGDSFARLLTEYAAEHGFKNMGHVPGAYAPNPTLMNGDPFKFYKYQQVPYIDLISGYLDGRPNIKVTSSVAVMNDREYTGTEIFGAWGDMNGDNLYRGPLESMVRDVTYFVSFAAGRTEYEGTSYRERHQRTDKDFIREWNDCVGRIALLTRGGRPVVDIALVYPIESLMAVEYLREDIVEREAMIAVDPASADPFGGMPFGGVSPIDAAGRVSINNFQIGALLENFKPGKYVEIPKERLKGNGHDLYESCDYNKISEILSNQIRRDFSFVEADEVLQDKFSVENGVLRLDNPVKWQEYKVVLMPSQTIVKVEFLKKLKDFYDKGGKLLFTGEIPVHSAEWGRDAEVVAWYADMLGVEGQPTARISRGNDKGGKLVYVPYSTNESLESALEELLPAADVRVASVPSLVHPDLGKVVFGADFAEGRKALPDEWLGELSYMHTVKNGKDVYYFVNTTNHPVSTTVDIRGSKKLEKWDPHTGEITPWESVRVKFADDNYTRITLKLEPVSAVLAVGK